MIHGDADETVSVVEARRFAKQFGARLTEVKGADYRFRILGGKEQAIDCAVLFLKTK